MRTMRLLAGAALVVAAVAQGNPKNGNAQLVNDPPACAADLMGAVEAVTSAVNEIMKSVAACPPKTDAGSGKDSACAAGIVATFSDFSLASEKLSAASMHCANTMATKKGGTCGEDISAAIKTLSVSSGCLIASTESCKPPAEGGTPFGCVVDVVDVVDSLANAAKKLSDSVKSCKATDDPDTSHTYLYNTFLATGCPAVPSPDWIQWGYWYAEPSNKDVMEQMFDWCMSARNGAFHDKHHAARLCCGSLSGSCDTPPVCTLQQQFTGEKHTSSPDTRGQDIKPSWAEALQ